jgi:hypothetical protein
VVAGDIFREVADKVYSLSLDMHPAVNNPEVSENNTPVIKNAAREDIACASIKCLASIYEPEQMSG